MLMRMLLWMLAKRFTWLLNHNEDFKHAVAKKICVLQFQTQDKKIARYYEFKAGKINSESESHLKPSLTFNFQHADTIRELMFLMAKDPSDKAVFMAAMNQGKIRFEGDVSLLTWFMTIADFLGPNKT